MEYKSFSQKRPEFKRSLHIFLIIAAAIAFYFILLRYDAVSSWLHGAGQVLEPIFAGLCFAFLMNPLVEQFEELFNRIKAKRSSDPLTKKQLSTSRGLSIFFTIIIVILAIYLLLKFTLLEIFDSLMKIKDTFPALVDNLNLFATQKLAKANISINLNMLAAKGIEYATNWVKTDLVKNISTWASSIAGIFTKLFKVIFNTVIGLACSIYLMYNRELFMVQCKKIIYANSKPKSAGNLNKFTKESVEILSKSIIGKIIDSVIVGILCYVFCWILDIPYAVLVGFIVGLTNVIPFFGPWIGGAVAGVLILIADPSKVIYFIVLVLLLQQVDMNFLTPKIVGSKVGLPAFWALVSCLIGQGIAGFWGLILGIPVAAIIYQMIQVSLKMKLEAKGLPSDTETYTESSETLALKFDDLEPESAEENNETETKKSKEAK